MSSALHNTLQPLFDALPKELQRIIERELAKADTVVAGELAGSEFEYIIHKNGADTLQPSAYLDMLYNVVDRAIDSFNTHLANHPDISDADKRAWHLEKTEKNLTTRQVLDTIECYNQSYKDDTPDLLQGMETLLLLIHEKYNDTDCLALVEAIRSDGLDIRQVIDDFLPQLCSRYAHDNTVILRTRSSTDDRIHLDVAGTIEMVTPPFAQADKRAEYYSSLIESVIKDVPEIFPIGSLNRGMYIRQHTVSYDNVRAGLPYSPVFAASRFNILSNPRIGNQLSSAMSDAGQHVTVGVIPERLNDTLRVLQGLMPLLVVMTQNSATPDTDGVAHRTIRGAWLAQRDTVRAGGALPDPQWKTKDVIAWNMMRIMNAPILGYSLVDSETGKIYYTPKEDRHESLSVVDIIRENSGLSDEHVHKIFNAQAKVWGQLRLRGIIDNQLLVEIRVADTNEPIKGLGYARFLQAIVQTPAVLDAVQQHLEAHNIIPQNGKSYAEDKRQGYCDDLRQTGIEAIAGRNVDNNIVARDYDTPYFAKDGVTINDTLNITIKALRENGHEHIADWAVQNRQSLTHDLSRIYPQQSSR